MSSAVSCEPLEGNYVVSTYPPFSCWSDEGASAFERVLHRDVPLDDPQALGLYVHVPFCVQRCQYCYYLSYDDRFREMDRYLQALEREIELAASMPAVRGRPLRFLYFGGGTPSVVPAGKLERLMQRLEKAFGRAADCETTFECAPKSVTPAKLRVLRDRGVNRLSLGVQQLDDDVLQANGRLHLVEDVLRAWDAVRETGFEVVNLDLIVGLVGQTDDSFLAGLERVIELGPESVTLYQLEIPLNTPLYRSIRDGELGEPPASLST
jgi:oxygen-independent coproporphyrinogen-3 oxidase